MTMPPAVTLEGFRHQVRVPVRWGDLDAMGHVNNATYLTYLEQARITYFRNLGLWDAAPGKVGPIMARCEIDYRAPLHSDDDVVVFTRCSRLGSRSFDTEQVIARVKDGALEIAAQSKIVVVVYDYSAGKSAPMPEAWREKLRAYEVEPPKE
ncbi:MAG: acyl-CoA thioesterase [Chloroflexi bacterium]|nr:acyl-CoA thioesterase [Chloroflexota bacterium]